MRFHEYLQTVWLVAVGLLWMISSVKATWIMPIGTTTHRATTQRMSSIPRRSSWLQSTQMKTETTPSSLSSSEEEEEDDDIWIQRDLLHKIDDNVVVGPEQVLIYDTTLRGAYGAPMNPETDCKQHRKK